MVEFLPFLSNHFELKLWVRNSFIPNPNSNVLSASSISVESKSLIYTTGLAFELHFKISVNLNCWATLALQIWVLQSTTKCHSIKACLSWSHFSDFQCSNVIPRSAKWIWPKRLTWSWRETLRAFWLLLVRYSCLFYDSVLIWVIFEVGLWGDGWMDE